MERSVLWVSQVWQQLNACLSRLGTHEALLGPQLFLSCPVVPDNTQAIVRCVRVSVKSHVTTEHTQIKPILLSMFERVKLCA